MVEAEQYVNQPVTFRYLAARDTFGRTTPNWNAACPPPAAPDLPPRRGNGTAAPRGAA
ncbi:hypothetical protein GCM10009527_076150 [Actinomadura nitritigenes]